MSDLPEAKKSLGQHWLTDEDTLKSIVEFAGVKAGDAVLEIGPGTGTLTNQLLSSGAKVIALEFDEELAQKLEQKYKSKNDIRVQKGDIRSFDLSKLPKNYKIVANIPYYLTANLIRKITDTDHKPQIACLLVQKEVAERLAAKPGELSIIAVAAQLYYEVKLGRVVEAEMFTPPPKVDSQVVLLKKRSEPLFPDINNLMKVVKAGFSQKRKKLRSSLNHGLGISKTEAEGVLKQAKINPDARAQELSLKQWNELKKALNS